MRASTLSLIICVACSDKQAVEAMRSAEAEYRRQLDEMRSQRDVCERELRGLREARASATVSSTLSLQPPSSPPVVGANAFAEEYAANEVAADAKYKGKPVIVLGNIQDFAVHLGRPSVKLGKHKQIMAFFTGDDDLKTLRKGNLILAQCVGRGTGITRQPLVGDCVVVYPENIAEQYPDKFRKNGGKYSIVGELKREID